MSLRSPLGRVLGLGTAKDGTAHWWAQRVTAVALVILSIWFLAVLLRADGLSYAEVVAFLERPLSAILMSLLCITLAYHSYLGIEVVIEDYVHGAGVKVASLIASRFAHVFVASASIYSILRIGLVA